MSDEIRRLIGLVEGFEQFPSQENFWFDYGFNSEIEQAIRNQFQTTSVACQYESERIGKWIAGNFPDASVSIRGGFYTTNDGEMIGHTWLTVDEIVFDPTAGQFDDYPNIGDGSYEETESPTELN